MKIRLMRMVFALLCSLTMLNLSAFAQSTRDDIAVKALPAEVLNVLTEYTRILGCESLEKCAESFVEIAGGTLINETGKKLRVDVPQFSLKKDFNNFKFYATPIELTRVNKRYSNGDGYGDSAIKGWVYKIWIDKKKGVNGMPAPISILVPEGHSWIKTPKVIGIGSL